MKATRIALVALGVIALGSCNIFINLFSESQVDLSAGKTTLASGEIVTLKTNLTNFGSLVSYKWYEDNVDIYVSSSDYKYSRFVTSNRVVTLRVTATDADGNTASDTIQLTVIAPSTPATVHVVNSSGYDIWYLYVSQSSISNWGPDQLRPDGKIYNGGTADLGGIPLGYWDLKVVASNPAYTWTLTSQNLSSPGVWTWTLLFSERD